ncbi:Mannose-P-dolichol utilization defect 1 protein [Vanrija pseudolonga]|uniref:Mannose-P-dolichol utilization defect 1 protein homolog n=1 Tax=Vanrija pseudolonga TaxID=143232 RepID=A0AAF0Y2M5_9TREE|nr:Mannose-P-dolichol utilization defect 1 protein [Vanrija pseudolonga]
MSAFHSAMTTITHNIPWILRAPATALIGEKCYTVLIYDFNITEPECFKYALSKGLGFGIVVGGGIVKIPQIIKIVKTHSARGLSLSAYILETASYEISLAYATRAGFPFSTYGENFFITIQNFIITLMILYYAAPKGASYAGLGANPLSAPTHSVPRRVYVGAGIIIATCLFLWSTSLCPQGLLSFLQLCTIPLGILSKAPQILENHNNRSTGNLSAFAVFSALLGCLARLFTTKQEVKDPLVFWGFAGAALLNLVLALQMIVYWKASDEPSLASRKIPAAIRADSPIRTEKVASTDGWARKQD